jgi:hypothetical protein
MINAESIKNEVPAASQVAEPITEERVHEAVIDDPHAMPSRTICIAVDESEFSQHGASVFLLPVACQWAADNLLNPETDQVILLNVRPFSCISLANV